MTTGHFVHLHTLARSLLNGESEAEAKAEATEQECLT